VASPVGVGEEEEEEIGSCMPTLVVGLLGRAWPRMCETGEAMLDCERLCVSLIDRAVAMPSVVAKVAILCKVIFSATLSGRGRSYLMWRARVLDTRSDLGTRLETCNFDLLPYIHNL